MIGFTFPVVPKGKFCHFDVVFSNSLIIILHQVKTKKVITVKEHRFL